MTGVRFMVLLDSPVFTTNLTDCHDIVDVLLKVALNNNTTSTHIFHHYFLFWTSWYIVESSTKQLYSCDFCVLIKEYHWYAYGYFDGSVVLLVIWPCIFVRFYFYPFRIPTKYLSTWYGWLITGFVIRLTRRYHQWSRSYLRFRSTWVHSRFLVGFVLLHL